MPLAVILSSPSGGGKSAITRALLGARRDVGYAVSATTRLPRPGERDGVEYHYLSPEEFDRKVAAGEFAEWATYAGERYGTLHAELDRLRAQGLHAILDIEVQGARQLRQSRGDTVSIFVVPPDVRTLCERLTRRGTESPAEVQKRLRTATAELQAAPEYDYVVVNDDLDRVVAQVEAIIDSEGRRPSRLPDLAARLAALTGALAERAAQVGAEPESSL